MSLEGEIRKGEEKRRGKCEEKGGTTKIKEKLTLKE
jgi:hypothetical protein